MTITPSPPPLSLAIVGHTNTGKTSLIRTLLRSEHFGNVQNSAGTTRHVEAVVLMADQTPVIELFDTPGLEDSIALLQTLQQNQQQTADDREQLQSLIQQEACYPEFNQEIKVIRQALQSDVLLYVIDVREPVLGKYHDEIAVLSMAARPIIPVFNFTTSDPENLQRWRVAMAQFNLHAVVAFDTVAFDFEAEKRLYQKLQSVVEERYNTIQQLIDFRHQRWLSLQQAAATQIAELLVDVASYRHPLAKNTPVEDIAANIQNTVRNAERDCLQKILAIFQFSDDDLQHHPLPVSNGSWEADLFDADTLKTFGLDAGSKAAKGALIGAGVDLMVAGLSLGTASMVGALLGAGWSTVKRYGEDALARVKGIKWYCIDDQTVTLLLLRQLQLLHTLLRRGHAAQNKISVQRQTVTDVSNTDVSSTSVSSTSVSSTSVSSTSVPKINIPKDWGERLQTMRNHPQWCGANQRHQDERSRTQFIAEQYRWILTNLDPDQQST